jgi:hypothetical protein
MHSSGAFSGERISLDVCQCICVFPIRGVGENLIEHAGTEKRIDPGICWFWRSLDFQMLDFVHCWIVLRIFVFGKSCRYSKVTSFPPLPQFIYSYILHLQEGSFGRSPRLIVADFLCFIFLHFILPMLKSGDTPALRLCLTIFVLLSCLLAHTTNQGKVRYEKE